MTLWDIASRWAELITAGVFVGGLALYRWDRQHLCDHIRREERSRTEEISAMRDGLEYRISVVEARNNELRHQLDQMMRAIEEQGQRIARIEATADLILRNTDQTHLRGSHDQFNIR